MSEKKIDSLGYEYVEHAAFGPRFRLEQALGKYGYWRIARRMPNGSAMSTGCGKDEAPAREEWRVLLLRKPCVICGDPPFGTWMDKAQRKMDERGQCFFCSHWTDVVSEMDQNNVVIEGQIFSVGESEESIGRRTGWGTKDGRLPSLYRHTLGHGGAEFKIEFFDGRRVTTTNLWAGGEIPVEFRAQLQDNARFEAREHSHAYVGVGTASCR